MQLQQIAFTRMNGKPESLAGYHGKVVLIVNVASRCGLTAQYEALEQFYRKYAREGVVVLGFPANDFLQQEPGSNDEIMTFCESHYDVTFPMVRKISVRGEQMHPLYAELIKAHPARLENRPSVLRQTLESKNLVPANDSDILWNFEKFLISRTGEVVERFAPDITPDDPRIVQAIQRQIAV